jgi:hypothetical protein
MAQTVTPLPSIGDVVSGRDVPGRELRISGHPQADRVVLSIWQDGRCQATVRLARADVPDVIHALAAGLVPTPAGADAGPDGTVHELRPGQGSTTTEIAGSRPTWVDQDHAARLRELSTRIRTKIERFTRFR